MIKRIFLGTFIIATITSCVSAKVYKDLEERYTNLKSNHERLTEENEKLENRTNQLTNDFSSLQKKYDELLATKNRLEQDYTATKNNLTNLQASYDALEKNSSAAIAENIKANRKLLADLEAKEKALAEENKRLGELKQQLASRSKQIDELESLIAAKDSAMKNLKEALSKALLDFEGKGLTVEERDGKVYVSLENKLLFASGSWAVGSEGRRAVEELGKVLAQNPDIAILIEGHTDNVPYKGSGQVKDNWDLSTKRATAIVQILRENKDIKPENLTAAGRSEHAPVDTNTTPEGRSKNRRIEVILTPKLDEVTRLLNEI
ncbi:flagellar motor protein MotB [Leptobacterium sp. I13]|uniref:OmpA/MotB family protein n=1 Tax=Leptobacterium meishanense TaxID=3128904 RepID=UPI0030EBE23C